MVTINSSQMCASGWSNNDVERTNYAAMWETTFARNSHAGLGRPVYEPSILVSIVKLS